MQNEISYAITRYIQEATGMKTVQIFDGIKLPTEKPFVTVEQLVNASTILTKRRESISKVYRYQIGLYAKSLSDRSTRQDQLVRIFHFDEFPLYKNPSQPATGSFFVELTNETPIPADDVANETEKFRMFFDISVTTVLRK
ncbi:hypothetical protein [Terribacillus saccharophilus]|uniref:hypothetical protein n=1 Tax=Terribacillus saccharophilus TaxID=361277 RepID=UPI003D2DF248